MATAAQLVKLARRNAALSLAKGGAPRMSGMRVPTNFRLRGLGDNQCTLDPVTGSQVCGTPARGPATTPTQIFIQPGPAIVPQATCQQGVPRYLPASVTTKVDPSQTGGPSGFDNSRTFTFQYHSGMIDVYYTPTQTVKNGVSYQYMLVSPGGMKSTPGGQPPAPNESCSLATALPGTIQPVSTYLPPSNIVPTSTLTNPSVATNPPVTTTPIVVTNPVTGAPVVVSQPSTAVSTSAPYVTNPATGLQVPNIVDPATGLYFSQEYPVSQLNPSTGYPLNYTGVGYGAQPYSYGSQYGYAGEQELGVPYYGYGNIQSTTPTSALPSNYTSTAPQTPATGPAMPTWEKVTIFGGLAVGAILLGKFVFGGKR